MNIAVRKIVRVILSVSAKAASGRLCVNISATKSAQEVDCVKWLLFLLEACIDEDTPETLLGALQKQRGFMDKICGSFYLAFNSSSASNIGSNGFCFHRSTLQAKLNYESGFALTVAAMAASDQTLFSGRGPGGEGPACKVCRYFD